MVIRLIKALFRWPLITITVAGLTYNYHNKLERLVNMYQFQGIETEEEFVDKRTAFKLKLQYNINDEDNLETYLMKGDSPLPIFQRKNRIMIGTAEYNFNSFTEREKSYLCNIKMPSNTYKQTKIKKSSSLFRDLYDIVTD